MGTHTLPPKRARTTPSRGTISPPPLKRKVNPVINSSINSNPTTPSDPSSPKGTAIAISDPLTTPEDEGRPEPKIEIEKGERGNLVRERGEARCMESRGKGKRFEILSWNVNGIGHLLPADMKKITNYFSAGKKRPIVETESESEGDDEYDVDAIQNSPLRNFLKRHNYPHMVCFQEVKITPKDEKTKRAVGKAANANANVGGESKEGWDGVGEDAEREDPMYEAHFNLPQDKFNAKGWGGKVYGVCTLIRTDILLSPSKPSASSTTSAGVGEDKETGVWDGAGTEEGSAGAEGKTEAANITTRAPDWDVEGRVLITEFPSWKLVVINGYWVNGTTSAWRDSENGEIKGTRHGAKRLFHSNMLNEVKEFEKKSWEVVLVGDMNIAPSAIDGYPGIRLGPEHVKNRADFNTKFLVPENEDGMRGVDSWRHLKGGKRGYTYHGEKASEWGVSCDRVDLGIVSGGVVDRGALVGAEIWESVEERGGSDHVPLSVVLDLEKLHSKTPENVAGPEGQEG